MYRVIDLFAGAGGLSYGFEMAGDFKVVAAAENNRNARDTFSANHEGENGLVMIEDVRTCDFKDLAEQLEGIDIVIGGPPCQGFSNANRQKNHIISMNNSLVKEYFRAIKEIQPTAFVMENVAMLASDTHKFYDSYLDHDEIVGLDIHMNAEDLVLADSDYNGYDLLNILETSLVKDYIIEDDLFHELSVLYKNRKSESKQSKYIKKAGKSIRDKIDVYCESATIKYNLLYKIKDFIEDNEKNLDYADFDQFLKFQKAFRLKKELDENKIIYKLQKNLLTGKIYASVNAYSVIDYVDKILEDKYEKKSKVINSLWFGVPQERKRFILIGVKKEKLKDKEIIMPEEPENMEAVTVAEAILDLKEYEVSETLHEGISEKYNNEDKLSRYAKEMRKGSKGVSNHIVTKSGEKAKERFGLLKEGENFHKLSAEMKDNYAEPSRTQNSIYLRLDSSKPSGTVINVRKSMWIHPKLDRAISIREAARLQSFPDKFIFKGTKDSQYQQVGNAVPPLMAKGIAEALKKSI